MKVGLSRARVICAVIAAAILVTLAVFGGACSNAPPTATTGGSSSGGPGGCSTPTPGCECATPGASEPCGSQISENGNTVTCSEGSMTCGTNGKWGACGGGIVKMVSREITHHPRALGEDAGSCNNPCDPYCEVIDDTTAGLDAGEESGLLVTDAGLSLAVSPSPPAVPCTGLAISPASQTVVLYSLTFPACGSGNTCAAGSVCNSGTCFPQDTFTASYTPAGCYTGAAAAVWSVEPKSVAQVDGTGDVTVINPIAGPITVTAYAGATAGLVTATATLNVEIDVLDTSRAPTGSNANNFDAGASGTDGLQILYPYQNVVLPLGLLPPTVQWSPGNDGGSVTSISVVDGGSGYTFAPGVVFTGGGGSGAAANATISGSVVSVTVDAGGTGFTATSGNTVPVSFSGGGGTGATGTATLTGEVAVGTYGLTVTGQGYTSAPTVSFTGGGGGSGAAAVANEGPTGALNTGTFAPTTPGSGFVGPVTLGFTGGGGSGATGTAALTGELTLGTYVTSALGTGYTSAPTVTFTGGGGSGAVATGILTGEVQTGTFPITGANQGSGYSGSPVAVSFTGGGGGGATATATTTQEVTPGTYTLTTFGQGYTGATATINGGAPTTAATASVTTTNVVATPVYTSTGTGTLYWGTTPSASFTGGTTTGTAAAATVSTTSVALGITALAIATTSTTWTHSCSTIVLAGSGGFAGTAATNSSGSVTSTVITNPGSDASCPAATTITATGCGNKSVTFTVTCGTYKYISAINASPQGYGYTAAPTVTLSGVTDSTIAAPTPTLSTGIYSFTITNPGAGYASVPTISFAGGSGTGATYTTALTLTGGINQVTVSAGGTGYTSVPTATIGGGGTGASFTPTLTNGVSAVQITNGGTGYTSIPTSATIGGPGTGATLSTAGLSLTQGVSSVTIVNGGSGYTTAPTVTFIDNGGAGPGTGATFTPTLADGVINITITAGGSGYTTTPTVVFTGGGGSGASFIAPMTNGIASVVVNTGGSGYTLPTTPIFGGGGSGAVGIVAITGSVSGLAITAGGSGYTSAPAVSLTGGDGSGATATCTISTVGGTGIASAVMVSLKYPLNGSVFNYEELLPEDDANYGDPYSASPIALGFTSSHASFSAAAWSSFNQAALGQTAYITVQRLVSGHLYPQGAVTIKLATDQLKGTVYYNTYGTQEVFNYNGIYGSSPNPSSDPDYFGAATLEIQPGQALPTPIEGYDSYNIGTCTGEPQSLAGCRVCHSVNANGTSLITQDSSDTVSHWLGLPSSESNPPCTVNAGEVGMTCASNSRQNFDFAGQYPDGTMFFTNSAGLQGADTGDNSVLYSMTTPTAPTLVAAANTSLSSSSVLNGTLFAGTPAFSPDGTHLAFNFQSSSGGKISGTSGDNKSLAVVDFNKSSSAFSNPRFVARPGATAPSVPLPTTGGGGLSGVAWFPTFTPDSSNLVFHFETYTNNGTSWGSGRSQAETRSQCDANEPGSDDCQEEGVHSELWYTDLATKTPRRLNCLNGVVDPVDASGHQNCPNGAAVNASYLPADPNYSATTNAAAQSGWVPATYGADWNMNYEPTILPQARGGYAWAVFTSRRAYGDITTANPYWSDPRYAPIAPGSGKITPKKLWVAALDTGVTDTTHDPSHPAFYLDGQELVAGNSRGYWVLNACTAAGSGTTCSSNLDCCSGAECQLDNPLPAYPNPPTSHCVATPPPGQCIDLGDNCASNPVCCTTDAICGGSPPTCVVPPPLPYYQEADFVRLYSPVCPSGTRPIWGNFEYGTITPSNSEIIIDVETANNPALLTTTVDAGGANVAAPLVQLPTIVSGATIPYPNGSQNVESALQAAGDQSALYLEVIVRLIPSTDGHSAPSLVQWNQQFDCLPSQ